MLEDEEGAIGDSWFVEGREDALNGRVKDFDKVPSEYKDNYLEGLKDVNWGSI